MLPALGLGSRTLCFSRRGTTLEVNTSTSRPNVKLLLSSDYVPLSEVKSENVTLAKPRRSMMRP